MQKIIGGEFKIPVVTEITAPKNERCLFSSGRSALSAVLESLTVHNSVCKGGGTSGLVMFFCSAGIY